LVLLWGKLFVTQNPAALYRDASVLIPVFVILIIPELWKNIRTKSWEIENSAFYTLRQVYSARLLLFGIADLLLFSIFFTTTAITMQITLYDMIIQCILPFNLTCCICFGILCSRRFRSEYTAISFCMIGAAIWHQIVISGKLYASVSEAVWLVILGLSGVYLVFAVHRLMGVSRSKVGICHAGACAVPIGRAAMGIIIAISRIAVIAVKNRFFTLFVCFCIFFLPIYIKFYFVQEALISHMNLS
jgi:hypothetical protein